MNIKNKIGFLIKCSPNWTYLLSSNVKHENCDSKN